MIPLLRCQCECSGLQWGECIDGGSQLRQPRLCQSSTGEWSWSKSGQCYWSPSHSSRCPLWTLPVSNRVGIQSYSWKFAFIKVSSMCSNSNCAGLWHCSCVGNQHNFHPMISQCFGSFLQCRKKLTLIQHHPSVSQPVLFLFSCT